MRAPVAESHNRNLVTTSAPADSVARVATTAAIVCATSPTSLALGLEGRTTTKTPMATTTSRSSARR